jgi:hypothetical protein
MRTDIDRRPFAKIGDRVYFRYNFTIYQYENNSVKDTIQLNTEKEVDFNDAVEELFNIAQDSSNDKKIKILNDLTKDL